MDAAGAVATDTGGRKVGWTATGDTDGTETDGGGLAGRWRNTGVSAGFLLTSASGLAGVVSGGCSALPSKTVLMMRTMPKPIAPPIIMAGAAAIMGASVTNSGTVVFGFIILALG